MNATILIACSWPGSAAYWATTLQKAQFVTHICHTNLPDALRMVDQHGPNLLLAEMGFDNRLGLELARQAVMRYPAIRCILFLPLTNEAWTQAMHTDISGYLPDGLDDSAEVIHCLNKIRQGRRYISPAFRNMALLPSAEVRALLNGLSERQKQILRLLVEGDRPSDGSETEGGRSNNQLPQTCLSQAVGFAGCQRTKRLCGPGVSLALTAICRAVGSIRR